MAAHAFGKWLRTYRPGQYSDRQLSTIYVAEFCVIEDLTPTAENMMRAKLAEVPGITRIVESIPPSKSKSGKRERPARWFAEPVKDSGGSGA